MQSDNQHALPFDSLVLQSENLTDDEAARSTQSRLSVPSSQSTFLQKFMDSNPRGSLCDC